MNPKSKIVKTYVLWIVDMLCIIASYLIATQWRYAVARDYGNRTFHYLVMVVMLMVCTVVNFFQDWNSTILKRGYGRELVAILKFNLILVVSTLVIVFFAQWAYILSRIVIANFVWINVCMMYVAHLIVKKLLKRYLSDDKVTSKIVIVTRRDKQEETIAAFHKRSDEAYQVVGSITVDDLKTKDDFKNVIEKLVQVPFDEVFINTPGMAQQDLRPLIDGFLEMGVTTHYNIGLEEEGAVTRVETFAGDYTVITYSRFKASVKKLMVKRLFDIIGGIVGLILTGIITIFLAPAIKIDSPGPVFFSQTRVGKNGRRFKIYKFRSMYKDAEARLKDLESKNEVNGLMFKMDDDPRVTKVGKFIRKTSLDEFPQFLNVLKGDMSLVGTRPPTEKEFEQYNEHYRRRLSMTPGLTGMWQVSGRSDITDFDEVVKLDLSYIDHWSLSLDFKILLKTVAVVFRHKGAK